MEGRARRTAPLIVLDASTIVGAVLRRNGIPRKAFDRAREEARIALSRAVFDEVREVLARPKFARTVAPGDRDEILRLLTAAALWFAPAVQVTDCRDPDDNMYLDLAAEAGAAVLVSSDNDLLVLHPWRGVRILRPAEFMRAQLF